MNAIDRAHLLYNESMTMYFELFRRYLDSGCTDQRLKIVRDTAYLRFARRFKAFVEV